MTLALARHVSATDMGSGMVLLDQRSGKYWQLNETAAAVIDALLDGRPPEDAAARLHERYPDAADRINADVENFALSLRKAKLVIG